MSSWKISPSLPIPSKIFRFLEELIFLPQIKQASLELRPIYNLHPYGDDKHPCPFYVEVSKYTTRWDVVNCWLPHLGLVTKYSSY